MLQAADMHGVVAGVADQLLGHLLGGVLGHVQVARPHPLPVDVVIQDRPVNVNALATGPPTIAFT